MDIKKLSKYLSEGGMPSFRIKQIQKAIFQDGVFSFDKISTLPKDLREKLEKDFSILSFEVVEILESADGQSVKALLKTQDENLIETVLISPKPGIWSACISCQIGCQMGCRFCATGSMGFKRDLSSEEISDQVLFWTQKLKSKKQKLDTIVYMGMGEPFNNWENVSESIRILVDKESFGFGSRSISISTSGIANGIFKLADEFPQVNLAISLHFADDKKRSHYMPVNQKDNLENLKKALKEYFSKTKRKVFIEYILLENINDGISDAQNLSMYLKSIGNTHLLHVNLIRYNTTSAGLKPSSKTRTYRFKEILEGSGISATIRKSLGEEIKGACGQLAGK